MNRRSEVDLTPLIALLAELYPEVTQRGRQSGDPRPIGDDIREWIAVVPETKAAS